jgi:hypothetical protein
MMRRQPKYDWPDHPLVDKHRHKCPWPGGDGPRTYGDETPWLAIPNWHRDYSPWGVQQYQGKAPKWTAICTDLRRKAPWRGATVEQRMFLLELWWHVADESEDGVIWGDPAKMRRKMGVAAGAFAEGMAYWAAAGYATYLSDDEYGAFQALIEQRRAAAEAKIKKTKDTTLHNTTLQDSTVQHSTTKRARKRQSSASPQKTTPQADTTKKRTRKATSTAAPQGQEPTHTDAEAATLTKSDAGGGRKGVRPATARTGRSRRPPSATSSEPSLLADHLAWSNPEALAFGKEVYRLLYGRKAPENMMTADEQTKRDVGVFVHLWHKELARAVNGDSAAFMEKAFERISKRKSAFMRKNNPGAYALTFLRTLAGLPKSGPRCRAGP